MNNDLFRIVYCSRTTTDIWIGSGEVDQILATSRRNNAREDVTGALLYNEGVFAQVLEGPLESVQYVFETIQLDPRHRAVVVLEAGPASERGFSDWAMAKAEVSDPVGTHRALMHILDDKNGDAGRRVLDLLERVTRRLPADQPAV